MEYGTAVTGVPRFTPSRRNWTPVMAKEVSVALAVSVVLLVTVAPAAGEVIVIVGGVPPPEPPVDAGKTSTMERL
jgi:hypothetical protein